MVSKDCKLAFNCERFEVVRIIFDDRYGSSNLIFFAAQPRHVLLIQIVQVSLKWQDFIGVCYREGLNETLFYDEHLN